MATSPALPRKRDAAATRARILRAAQCAFSETGYSHTGIRDIARRAETSSTLLLRYFGSKAGLFEAALTDAMPVFAAPGRPRAQFGRDLGQALLDPANAVRPPLMIAMASGDAEAAAIAARVMEDRGIAPLAQWLGGSDARARAIEITMLAMGLVSYLRQLPLPPASAGEHTHMERWFAAAVQAIVDNSQAEKVGR